MPRFSWTELVSKLIETKVIAFLVVGAVSLGLAAAKGCSTINLDISNPAGRVLLAAAGLLLEGAATFSFLREPHPGISPTKIKRKLDLKILDTTVEPSYVRLTGSINRHPSHDQLCIDQLCIIEFDETTRLHTPRGDLNFNEEGTGWNANIQNWHKEYGKKTFIVAWLGPNSRKLVEHFEQCLQQTGASVGIKSWPDDFIPLASKETILLPHSAH